MGGIAGLPETKTELRQVLLKRRAGILKKADKDRAITGHLLALPLFQQAQRLFLYAGTAQEVDTGSLLEKVLEAGREVYLPRCLPDRTELEFYRIFSRESLKPGHFGVLEPEPVPGLRGKLCPRQNPPDICIVPGVAFDEQGNRMGYGKGYYDRFLAGNEIISVGLCYRELVFPELPKEKHDQRVSYLATEEGVIACCTPPRPGKE